MKLNNIAIETLWATDQHLHLCDYEPLNMSNRYDKGKREQVTVRSTQTGPTVGHTLYQPQFIGETIECTLFIVK